VSHLIGNRASFLCTKAPMPRVISEWHPISGRFLPPSPPPAAAPNINESKPGGPALATRARTALGPIRQSVLLLYTEFRLNYGSSFFGTPMVMARKSGRCD
jgi:hypothetical protein